MCFDRHTIIGGPLDIDVCPTDADAVRVATEACRLVNKYPLEIDALEFPEEEETAYDKAGRYPALRTLMELPSLLKMRPNFDFGTLRYVFRSDKRAHGAYFLYNQFKIFD